MVSGAAVEKDLHGLGSRVYTNTPAIILLITLNPKPWTLNPEP